MISSCRPNLTVLPGVLKMNYFEGCNTLTDMTANRSPINRLYWESCVGDVIDNMSVCWPLSSLSTVEKALVVLVRAPWIRPRTAFPSHSEKVFKDNGPFPVCKSPTFAVNNLLKYFTELLSGGGERGEVISKFHRG